MLLQILPLLKQHFHLGIQVQVLQLLGQHLGTLLEQLLGTLAMVKTQPKQLVQVGTQVEQQLG
jgi:hypothetical protein